MKVFAPQLPGLNLPLAAAFLDKLGGNPWRLISGAQPRNFTAKTAAQMGAWIRQCQEAGRPVFAMPPTVEGGHWFIAARLPLTASPAQCYPPPQFIIAADDFTLLWRLVEPVGAERAQTIAKDLVGRAGGRPAIGEPVPLPGTILAREVKPRMVQRFPVHLLPPLAAPAYRVAGDSLQGAATGQAALPLDPRLMAVSLASEAVWQPGAQSNGFMLVLGASGSGKTETLKVIGAGIHGYGIPVLVLDFHGDVLLPGVPSTALSSAPGSSIGLNPLEVDVESARENGLYDQRTAILEMARRAVPQLGHKQANALHGALEAAYRAAGIHDDDPGSWERRAPTFGQVMASIDDEGLLAGVRGLFGHPIFGRAEHLGIEAMLKASMRLDLSKLPDGVRYVTAETLLRRIFTALRMRGPIPVRPVDDTERFRLFILIDEARLITMGGSSDIVTLLMNEARKFGLGLILASQAASHFPHEIRNNAASWLVLRPQTMTEARLNAPNVGVEPDALMALTGRGDGYLRLGNSPAQRIQVKPLD